MTPERWQEIKSVLATALEIEPGERDAYLQRNCAGDPSLRQEVERLLSYQQSTDSIFLDQATLATAAAAVLPDVEHGWVGRVVGPYRILEQLGAGGMGEVYRACRADDHYRQEVAVKIVRAGDHSGYIVGRFKNERQILAGLDHPNIARLLDGGSTDEGTPYFVMELIEGQSITDYCDTRKLGVTERLKLFSQVCAAVAYAHQRLIVHRDIKPANILVTADGTPKLLDFGIAKILDFNSVASSDATLTGFRILTPRYASPEQIRGEPMTTASDVYSLGVVLYELLTGQSPYGAATGTAQELAQAACDSEALKPSTVVQRITVQRIKVQRTRPAGREAANTIREEIAPGDRGYAEKLTKRLRGDLDNIVLMAVRKEPARRYASVEQLKEDIRRHLENLPVSARRDTLRYRTSKFVLRHSAAVVLSGAVALALLAGIGISLHEARIARVERARAERRFNDVRKLVNSLMFEVHDSIRDLPGTTQARKLIVTRALEYLDSLSQEASGDIALQRELAAAYDRVGDVLGYTGAANLGDFSGALQSYTKALVIREAAAATSPGDVQLQTDLLENYFRLSFVLEDTGDFAGALRDLSTALPIAERLARQGAPRSQEWLAGIYWRRANVLKQSGKYQEALEDFRRSSSIREPIATRPNANPISRTHLAADYTGLGITLYHTGDLGGSLDNFRKAQQILEPIVAADPSNATLREYLGEAYQAAAPALEKLGRLDEAMDYDRKAYEVFAALSSADPTNALARVNLGCSEEAIGHHLVLKGEISQALPHIRKAISIFEPIEPKDRYAIAGEAESYSMMGAAFVAFSEKATSVSKKADHLRDAELWYRKSLSAWEQEPDHGAIDPLDGDTSKDQVAQYLAKCERALSELAARSKVTPAPTSHQMISTNRQFSNWNRPTPKGRKIE